MLVEDHPGYREVITRALKGQPDMELISSFGTAEIALRDLESAPTHKTPDIVLLDLNLPGMSGLDAIPWFKKYVPSVRVINLTQSDQEADIVRAISLGAAGYLLKSSTVSQIREGVRVVMAGGSSLDPNVAKIIIDTFSGNVPVKPVDVALSERELEVLNQLGEGLAKKEISSRLGITADTVAYHVKRIYDKLNVVNAASAVDKAHRQGLFRK